MILNLVDKIDWFHVTLRGNKHFRYMLTSPACLAWY